MFAIYDLSSEKYYKEENIWTASREEAAEFGTPEDCFSEMDKLKDTDKMAVAICKIKKESPLGKRAVVGEIKH